MNWYGYLSYSVLSRVSRAFVIIGLCLSIGAPWAALQSVAWATMLVANAKHDSLSQAVAKTFDGEHPCGLCKGITAAQHEQKQNKAQPLSAKPDLICAIQVLALRRPCAEVRFAAIAARATRRISIPTTPPPRSALS